MKTLRSIAIDELTPLEVRQLQYTIKVHGHLNCKADSKNSHSCQACILNCIEGFPWDRGVSCMFDATLSQATKLLEEYKVAKAIHDMLEQ